MSSFLDTLFFLFDDKSVFHVLLLLSSASLASVFQCVHRLYEEKAQAVSSVETHKVCKEFAHFLQNCPDKTLKYVALSGLVATSSKPLEAQGRPDIKGVANFRTQREVKEKFVPFSQRWENEDQVVSSVQEQVPMELADRSGTNKVQVINPQESEWFNETLEVVSKEFRPSKDPSLLDAVLDITAGERLRGYSNTEKMLRLGANLLVVGECCYDDEGVKIRSPASLIHDFIVSRKSVQEISNELKEVSRAWKAAGCVTAGATAVAAYYLVRRLRQRYVELSVKRRRTLDKKAIRERREVKPVDRDGNVCVVCLVNPREVVLLECGHVCVCADCLDKLPGDPLVCPVCRSEVTRCLPIYNV